MTPTHTVTPGELEALIAAALCASQTAPEVAGSVARALTAAEVDGHKGHGLSRVPSYAAQSLSGKVDGNVMPAVDLPRPGVMCIDAGHGFAYPSFDRIVEDLPGLCGKNGIAAASVFRSHHFGVAGWHMERLAERGIVAIALGNTPKAIAPWGGRDAVFGTNPIAFAAPQRDREPIVIDLATSQVARGLILKAAQAGEPIPEGWALDADGNPVTDAKAALGGTMQPLGGAKGAALAMMVEILAATLTGANYGFEATSFFDGEGAPPGVGQMVIGIDPDATGGRERFLDRLTVLAGAIEQQDGARLPGTRRLENRHKAHENGLVVDMNAWERAREVAGLA